MLSLTATQTALVAATSKAAMWSFLITDKNGVIYRFVSEPAAAIAWATGISWDTGITWDAGDHLSSIVLTDFSGIDLRRNLAEGAIIAPSETTFNLSNAGSTLTFSDFKGGSVLIELYLEASGYAQTKVAGWRFAIKTAEPAYQNIRIVCEDFLQKYLRGDYPNTRLPADIFASNRSYENDGVCIPVPFGTAYVPLRDVYVDGAVTVTAATIAAVASAAGANCKFTDSASGLGAIQVGATVTVSGFTTAANNGSFQVLKASAAELEIAYDAGLVDEAEGDDVTITHGAGYLMLGDPARTYTITKIRNPSDLGYKSEYASASYTFTQSTVTDADGDTWRVFQPIIADTDLDGTADAPGSFGVPGGLTYDPPVQFTRDDTASMTNPADVIAFVLEDMGVPSAWIDDAAGGTFATAHTTFDGWGLTFNGAFWYKEPRETVLARLLNMCHATLRVGELVELHVLSKTSQKTITAAEVLRSADQGEGSFTYRDVLAENYSDCGHVAWQESGAAQDRFMKVLVPAKATRAVVSGEILECPFVQDSQDIQRIGTLYYYRKLLKDAEIGLLAPGTCLALQPDDVATINHANYGGSYAVLIDAMKIMKDLSIQFTASHYSAAMDDWGDLSPAALTIPADDTAHAWQPSISGPQTDQDIGRTAYTQWGKEYLTVGPTTNVGQETDLQKALNAVGQAGGGAIYLLNGTYQMTDVLYPPDVNLEIAGQSRGGVELKNKAGSNLLALHNLTKSYNFHDFTVTSQDAATYKALINVYGDTAAENTAQVTLERISLSLSDGGSWGGNGDYGIQNYKSDGRMIVRDVRISGGKIGIYAGEAAAIVLNAIECDAVLLADVYLGEMGDFVVDTLMSRDFWQNCVAVVNTVTASRGVIRGINAIGKAISGAANQYGVQVAYIDKLQFAENTIRIAHAGTGAASGSIGLIMTACNEAELKKNIVDIDVSDTSAATGLSINASNDCIIANNRVKVDNDDTTANHEGIILASNSSRCVVAGNNIDMVNNDAKDLGICLNSGSNNNQGGDNITYNCGTSVNDGGTGNAITAKDV